MEQPSKKRQAKAPAKPEHTVRFGGVSASIWLKQSATGYFYYDYSLSRSWKSTSSGRMGYSTNFFERHRDDLVATVTEATRWINEKLSSTTTTTLDTTKDAA